MICHGCLLFFAHGDGDESVKYSLAGTRPQSRSNEVGEPVVQLDRQACGLLGKSADRTSGDCQCPVSVCSSSCMVPRKTGQRIARSITVTATGDPSSVNSFAATRFAPSVLVKVPGSQPRPRATASPQRSASAKREYPAGERPAAPACRRRPHRANRPGSMDNRDQIPPKKPPQFGASTRISAASARSTTDLPGRPCPRNR